MGEMGEIGEMGELGELGDRPDEEEEDASDEIKDWDLPLSFTRPRHVEAIEGIHCITQTWRMKERMKTVSVALVLCLNVGVDPPDVVKTQPCAQLECWIDPLSTSPTKALEAIGKNLQKQYERWQPRARYKQSLDPTVEDVKKLCTSLRRNAKEERVLFHYNGHGVPKPTVNGEIWVFNRMYTQYIPLSIFELQTWMGAPSIYVYDCSNAGIIVESFKQFAEQHEMEYEKNNSCRNASPTPPSYKNCIQLAACAANQVLPMNPDLPADLFTSCLTTPIKVALRWFVMQNTAKLVPKITLDLIDKIPGQLSDRRTMLGELNWIFTAITDTIAWNILPRDLFQMLFRQDLLVASLFRNFLLAERIMRSYDCTPVSSPALPPTYQHPMWQAWDLALDLSLGQLPGILAQNEVFEHLPFFEEQLTAFQVWLQLGSEQRSPPEQLPIVLQVLLSQVHRLRALVLLGKFLDLGPWAVNLGLSVGIFPYVLKLLQSSAKELRPLLVFIWAKILAVDSTCQADLVRDNGHKYFLSVLQDSTVSSEHRTMSAFVLACIVHDYPSGQKAAMQGSLVSICLEQLSDPCRELRQWLTICLARMWDKFDQARWCGVRDTAHEKLYTLLHDSSPEVRAAAVYALGTFINSVAERSEHANNIDHSVAMMLLNTVTTDMSGLVRQELVAALQWLVLSFEGAFLLVASHDGSRDGSPHHAELASPVTLHRIASRDRLGRMLSPAMDHVDGERMNRVSSTGSICSMGIVGATAAAAASAPPLTYGSVYTKLWNGLTALDRDPHPQVAEMSRVVTNYIRRKIKDVHREVHETASGRLSSTSLPPSPNRGHFLAGESPPDLDKPRALMRSSLTKSRKLPNTINEENGENVESRKPLVTTQYVAWACKHFAQPVMKESDQGDFESLTHYEREWRYLRNEALRREAREERLRLGHSKIDYQALNARKPHAPAVLEFHPFDQQIAVAGRDFFEVWDWGAGAKLASGQQNKGAKGLGSGAKPILPKITSLQWVNGHDVALLLTASDDGTVRVFRPSQECELVTAWQALSDLGMRNGGPGPAVVTTWEQLTQTLITAGDARILRLWDARHEMRIQDIPTGADSAVTCLDSTFASIAHERTDRYVPKTETADDGLRLDSGLGNRGLIAAGFADGSVRLFDKRLRPTEARVKTWREHSLWALAVQLKGHQVYSGSTSGDVKIYDVRQSNNSLHSWSMHHSLTSMAIHRFADTIACSTTSQTGQTINVYTLSGSQINVIKFYDGFMMAHRTGPVNCLAYHPHRVALAAGTVDNWVSVYCLEQKR